MWPTGHPGKTSQDSKDVAEADKFSEENTNTEHMEDEQVIRRFIESVSTVQKSQVSFSFIAMRIRALRRSSSLLAVALEGAVSGDAPRHYLDCFHGSFSANLLHFCL